ncbi:MAG: hypothetical protein ABJI69_00885 [Balneola sp.]
MVSNDDKIQKEISNTWESIDIFLKENENSLLAFDFTTVSHYLSGRIKIKSNYKYLIKNYPDYLTEFFKLHGYSIPKSQNSNTALLYNVSENNRVIELEDVPVRGTYSPEMVNEVNIVALNTWNNFVEKKKIAGSTWTLFKDFINDERTGDRIEVGVYILLKKSLRKSIEKKINDYILNEVFKFLFNEGINYFSSEFIEQRNKFQIKASISEIINRNYAHHIGSHVSRRASFEKILERLNLKVETLKAEEIISIAAMYSRLETYKDERSEFIASVTNSPSQQALGLYQDIIRPFIENTLLIDNIAKNEGIGYHFGENNKKQDGVSIAANSMSQLIVRVFLHKDLISKLSPNSENIAIRDKLSESPEGFVEQYATYTISNEKEKRSFTSLNIPYFIGQSGSNQKFYERLELAYSDIKVGLPGGLGKHAIYSLLENYIRNTAKHAYDHILHHDRNVEIILKVKPDLERRDAYILILTDNISDGTKAHGLQERLHSKLLENSGGMGIADMKICASLLSGLKLNEENLANALEIKEEKGHIAFNLKLLKPKEIALIGCEKEREDSSEGIFYFDSLQTFLSGGIHSHSFNFAFTTINEIKKVENPAYKHLLPRRTFIILDESEDTELSIDKPRISKVEPENGQSLIEWCWQSWLHRKYPDNNPHLSIYFEQTETDTPTREWLEASKEKYNSNAASISLHYDVGVDIFPEIDSLIKDQNALFDRHANLINNINSSVIRFTGVQYWSLIDKNNFDYDMLSLANTKKKPFLLPLEMGESAMMNILILDERVAELAHRRYEGDDKMKRLTELGGFRKYSFEEEYCQVMDACWASNMFIATHIDETPVHNSLILNSIQCQKHHYHKIGFTQTEHKISIDSKVNFFEDYAKYTCKHGVESWLDSNRQRIEEYPFNDVFQKTHLRFDTLIIHRTILKSLIEGKYGDSFLANLDVDKIYVVTGGGTIDFLPEDHRLSILPSNILYDFIVGRRPAKLSLARILK